MKLPFRFKKLSEQEVNQILRWLNEVGRADGPYQTEKHTMFFLYPYSEHEGKGLRELLESVLCLEGLKDKLVRD